MKKQLHKQCQNIKIYLQNHLYFELRIKFKFNGFYIYKVFLYFIKPKTETVLISISTS